MAIERVLTDAQTILGQVHYARMQVPSITPLYSQNEDDGGGDDTSFIDKKITAIVMVSYAIR